MEIIIADNRGFCPGVRRAVQMALEALQRHGPVYSLGHLIHNRQVVDGLMNRGLTVVEDISDVPTGSVVLIRSHGVSPRVLEQAQTRSLTVVDATCGLVRRAQELVAQMSHKSYQIVVIGEADHPEVQGLTGYARDVIVINHADDVEVLPPSATLAVIAQTTISPDHVAKMVAKLIAHGFDEIRLLNTLCNQSVARQHAAQELAGRVDIMFVLGGLHSANTGRLAQLCREADVRTHHLEDFSQFRPDMIDGAERIGITAGASTPDELIDEFVDKLRDVT